MVAPSGYALAHLRYQGFRDAAYDVTWNQFSPKVAASCNLKIMPFDERALTFWQAIKHFRATHPDGGLPWDAIYNQLIRTPRRFDLAIWDGDVLCGLCAGMASRGDENVTIRWIERFNTQQNHVRGLVSEVAVTAAEHYAVVLGRRRVLLRHPLPGTTSLYEALGFSLAPRRFGAIYYVRDVV